MLNSQFAANVLLIAKKFRLCTTHGHGNPPETDHQATCDFCLYQQFEREKPFV